VAPDIKTAEAAKVIENIQRDINIALMNELSLIFHRLGVDTKEVLKAAGTKWNFLRFEPGLVGGHCIGVDPYYLAYKAREAGYIPQLILAGRAINESIPMFVAEETIKLLVKAGKTINGSKVLVLGFTFKENVPDVRNTKVYDLVRELQEFGVKPIIYDPVADKEGAKREYGVELAEDYRGFKPYDAVVVAVKHKIFAEEFDLDRLKELSTEPCILVDVKGMYEKDKAITKGFVYWRL
jgi:UDP-N-acetyl-D-galactosamine dehydrogenase